MCQYDFSELATVTLVYSSRTPAPLLRSRPGERVAGVVERCHCVTHVVALPTPRGNRLEVIS